MLARRLLPLLLLSALSLSPIAQAQYRYTTERLVTGMTGRAEYEGSSATVISNNGTVGGTYNIWETWYDQAYTWKNGVFNYIPNKPGEVFNHFITGINGHGAMAVNFNYSDTSSGEGQYYHNGVFTPIPRLNYLGNARVNAINNNGVVVGDAGMDLDNWTTPPDRHAFIYQNGVTTDIGTLGGRFAYAQGVNDAGMVVGGSLNAAGVMRAFIYDAAGMHELGTLGGAVSHAYDVNQAGDVVGMSQTADGDWHGFLYRNGTMTDIGLMEQYSHLDLDINDAGQIIGKGWLNGAFRPVLLENGVMTDVQTFIDPADRFQLWSVAAINDHGQIVGTGCYTSPIGEWSCTGVLLNPIPEPATWGMLGVGLGVLAYCGRRRGGGAGRAWRVTLR